MRTGTLKLASAAISLGAIIVCTASAQSAAVSSSTPPPLTSTEQWIKDAKNPVSWLTWGADLRLRNEYLDTTLTLDEHNPLSEQDYFRFRARIFGSIKPVDDLSLNLRLSTEEREWMRPAGYSPYKGRSGWDYTEGMIDTLNLQWRNIFGQPLSVIVGRQDLMFGDGWLTGDGTPYDGSWTYFLDAARVTWELKDQHTTIEAMGILQNASAEAWLPTINNQNRYLSEQNEKGAILSVVNTSLKAANFNPYFVYKHDDAVNTHGMTAPGVNSDIYTLGARISGLPAEHWKYSVEGAYQFGEKQDPLIKYPEPSAEYRDINAYGWNTRLSYLFKDSANNQVSLAYEFLTGDDPNTSNDEMFDGLWGRYPRWSELGLYSFARETRVGQQANYHRFGPTWTVNPVKNAEFTAMYYAMFADHDTPTRESANNPPLFSHNSNFRGHFVSAILKYKFSQHMTGHLWGELLFPGDYYTTDHVLSFLRAELMFTF